MCYTYVLFAARPNINCNKLREHKPHNLASTLRFELLYHGWAHVWKLIIERKEKSEDKSGNNRVFSMESAFMITTLLIVPVY
jgi:hypothetical protein